MSHPVRIAGNPARVETSGDDTVVRMAIAADQANFMGSTHGGVVFSLAERAMAEAAPGYGTVDAHLLLTGASAPGDVLEARVVPETTGRTLQTFRVTVTRNDGRVVGLFSGAVVVTMNERSATGD